MINDSSSNTNKVEERITKCEFERIIKRKRKFKYVL